MRLDPMDPSSVTIWPVNAAADISAARMLFREYAAALQIDLCFQNFADELADLPGKYAPPSGGLWLARRGDELGGCVALRQLDRHSAEMKRLYVRPEYRRMQLGRRLAEQAIAAAIAGNYRRVCLDTLPSMSQAVRLYRSLGFREIEPYYHNPVHGAIFFELDLAAAVECVERDEQRG